MSKAGVQRMQPPQVDIRLNPNLVRQFLASVNHNTTTSNNNSGTTITSNHTSNSALSSNHTTNYICNVTYHNNPKTEDAKLKKALQTFDRILSEFAPKNPVTPPPKFQKSKTCSIIESRCILKKTNSDPRQHQRLNGENTKSLWDLNNSKIPVMTGDRIVRYGTYKVTAKEPIKHHGTFTKADPRIKMTKKASEIPLGIKIKVPVEPYVKSKIPVVREKGANRKQVAAQGNLSCADHPEEQRAEECVTPGVVKYIVTKMEMIKDGKGQYLKCARRPGSVSDSDDSGNASNEGDLSIKEDLPSPTESNNSSKVLLRAGALTTLESARDERLRACIVQLQARARGLLARRALVRRRVQHVAAKCIQRNVRAFLAVRDWPWWRLYIRVAPLLSVNRTEDMLKKTTEELEIMRAKLEKIETERATLKHENDKLENKLSEMTAELAVEQSTGSLAAERLSAETSERLRLEKELQGLRTLNTTLQQTSEKLETELMYTRAETNGSIGEGSEDGSEDGVTVGGYKRRLQAVLRELEATRRQLRQQHEDDLEQLVMVKKQLEKKVADAYEEVEEQRQVAAQWKRKAQKAASDANDIRLLADEQGARAALLDKRQKRCDAESHQMQEEIRREKQTKERIQRELDLANAEKYALEQSVADLKMELEMKEDKLLTAQRELDDMTFSGKTEEEVGALKRAKHELEKKCHDQEEELDEMAGQLQLLESHKVRLEMSLEQQRKASRLEAAQRDEELEEARAQTTKKVKALEAQLETEHSERTLLLRERHELERRLSTLEESARAEAAERDAREQKAKRDLRRARALALDAQAVLEKREKDSNAKAQLRQLRDKLDDAEVSLRAAVKARQAAEAELAESTSTCEEAVRARREAESRAAAAQRDATAAQTQLEEAEEEAAEVMKKYRACVQALSEEQRACREATARAIAAEEEARAAKDRADELATRLASVDNAHNVGQAAQHDVLELKTKDLEARLELEQTARSRLEAQATRARDAAASSSQAASAAQARESAAAEELRKTMRTVRELREEVSTLNVKLEEAVRARNAAETKLDSERSDTSGIRQELRNAQSRIVMLQQAIVDELSPNNNSDSDDSYSSDESLETFLTNHKIGALSKVTGSVTPRSGEERQSRSSASSSKQLSPTKESYA